MCNKTRGNKKMWRVAIRTTQHITIEADNEAIAGAMAVQIAQQAHSNDIRVIDAREV